jgi:disulfide bond formation protein DsbB
MYTALFVGGLIYAGIRNRLRPIRLRLMFLLLLPLVLDGATHALGSLVPALDIRSPDDSLWSFNWWVRMISGVLFAVGCILGIYTRLDRDLRGVGEHDTPDGIHIRVADDMN